MVRKIMTAALGCAALAAGAPLLAQGHGHGGGGGMGVGPGGMGGMGMGAGMQGNAGMGMGMRGTGMDMRDIGRLNSQGPAHASATGIAHANSNSVLKGSTVVGGPLTGLTVGASVLDSTGQTVGTVSRVIASNDGTVRNILVRSTDGHRTIPLSPNNVSLSGSTLTALTLSSSDGRRH